VLQSKDHGVMSRLIVVHGRSYVIW